MGRPGAIAAYFGPCAARTVDAARVLLEWFPSRHGHENAFWDLFPGHAGSRSRARIRIRAGPATGAHGDARPPRGGAGDPPGSIGVRHRRLRVRIKAECPKTLPLEAEGPRDPARRPPHADRGHSKRDSRSFSDGGRHLDPDRAFSRALLLEEEGADLIDIGAESTRPGSTRIGEDEELRRLVPV